MQRRQFSRLLALLIFPWPVGVLARAGVVEQADWSQQFAEALRNLPWLVAWGNIDREQYQGEAAVSGHWPEELRGTLYRTGPARHEVHGYRNHHWFDGDGMVQAWRIGMNGVQHQARLVETAKVKAERAAGRVLYPGLVAAPPGTASLTKPDDVNLANTNVLNHHGRLFALWEAGSPYEIDKETLATKGLHRFPEPENTLNMAGVPFSAHPRADVDGSLWNFGYISQAGLLVFWHINPDGRLRRAARLPIEPITMPHDFVVTEKHLVLLLPPFHYRPETEADGFLRMHEWRPQDPCRVLVVDKNDLASHFFTELPAQWVFHFGNAWEDRAGIIRFDAARSRDPGVMTDTFTEIMRGKLRVPVGSDSDSFARHHRYRIDTRMRTISEESMLEAETLSEFPCIDPRVGCRRYRRLLFLSQNIRKPAAHGMFDEVSVFDMENGSRQFFRYPEGQIPEEHLYVPRPGSDPESRDWVLGTAYDWQRGVHVLNLFDAEGLADGPAASAELPYAIPIGLHGKFVTG